jgi:hypothetical protein
MQMHFNKVYIVTFQYIQGTENIGFIYLIGFHWNLIYPNRWYTDLLQCFSVLR